MRSFYILILLLLVASPTAFAQNLPPGFSRQILANNLNRPTVMAFAPDGRLFICEQDGKIKIYKNGAMLPTPFAQLAVDGNGERGLLGLDFDPDFASNGYLYVYYTKNTSPKRNRVARLTRDPANPDLVLAGSETLVLELDPLSGATNHNGGFIQFGTDGKLYVAVGDNAASSNSQNYHTYHGNLLRINKDGSAPTDNPFYNSTPGGSAPTPASRRTWAIGLRNPYSFDINHATGKIFVNDVGRRAVRRGERRHHGGPEFWLARAGRAAAARIRRPGLLLRQQQYRRLFGFDGLLRFGRRVFRAARHKLPLPVPGQVLLHGLLQRLDQVHRPG